MSLEIPNLDDKTFEELFLEARALIPRYAPQWTDHNFSDPGITFIDLFAWLGEMQIYSTDRITPRHKRKFLKYLETFPKPAGSAIAHVALKLRDATRPVTVQQNALLFAVDNTTGLFEPFEATEKVAVSAASLVYKFFTKNSIWSDASRKIASENGYFEPFDQSMPTGGKLLIGINQGNSGDELRMRFELIENDLLPASPATVSSDRIPSVSLRWETWNGTSWQTLTTEDKTCGLNHTGDIILSGMATSVPTSLKEIPGFEKAPATDSISWISISPSGNDGECYEIPPRIHSIRLHSVPVLHGQTWRNELHDGTGLPLQSVAIKNTPILSGTAIVKINNRQWSEVIDFDASSPIDPHFTIDYTYGIIRFGDGEHGDTPPEGRENIVIETYRSGGGLRGNIDAGKIVRFEDPEYGNVSIADSTRATGGTGEETIIQALDRARQERKLPTRIISEKDIEALVRATPGTRIHAVKVLFGYHPLFCSITMPGSVSIVVLPAPRDNRAASPARPSTGFLKRIGQFLDNKRLITTDLHVIGPKYIPISVAVQLKILPRMGAESLKTAIKQKLDDFLNPCIGGPESKGWPFGYPVVAPDLIALLQRIDGVVCVKSLKLSSGPDGQTGDRITLPKIGVAYASDFSISTMSDCLFGNKRILRFFHYPVRSFT